MSADIETRTPKVSQLAFSIQRALRSVGCGWVEGEVQKLRPSASGHVYDELKRIVERLDAEDVSVHEMCELFGTGKSLEKELRAYLETQQGKPDEIEAGEHLPAYRIVAASAPGQAGEDDEPWGAAPTVTRSQHAGAAEDFSPATPLAPADHDIPF